MQERRSLPGGNYLHISQLFSDFLVEGFPVIVVEGEGCINLPERQMGMLPPNLFGIPVVRQSVESDFDNFGRGAFQKGYAV